jgi:DNA repair ATPase RecN
MTDQELKDLVANLAVSQAKTDVQLAKTDAQLAKTDAQLAKTDVQLAKTDERLNRIAKMVGAMGNNQGDVAEEYFINSLKDSLTLLDKKFDILIPNFKIEKKRFRDEYDILLVNGSELAMIEVKYKLHTNDVDKLAKKITNLKDLPQYKNYKIYAGVAGFKIPDDVVELAISNGYFVLQREGDIIETISDELRVA